MKKKIVLWNEYGAVGHSFDDYAVALNSNLIPVTGKIIFRCPEYNSTLYQPLSAVTWFSPLFTRYDFICCDNSQISFYEK